MNPHKFIKIEIRTEMQSDCFRYISEICNMKFGEVSETPVMESVHQVVSPPLRMVFDENLAENGVTVFLDQFLMDFCLTE